MFDSPFIARGAVTASDEFFRISGLPRRTWQDPDAEALADQLTLQLRTANGTMTLRPGQAVMLYEAWTAGGLFCSGAVSCGKTLPAFLLSRVLQAQRPVLMAPSKLHRRKTGKELIELSQHWDFGSAPIKLLNYETLGVVANKGSLEDLAPDLLILDEVHKLANPKASRTRRVQRYLRAHPECKVCAFSGSTIKRSIKDYAHILEWCLGLGSPLPVHSRRAVLEEWDLALAEKLDMSMRIEPGALLQWCEPGEIEEHGPTKAARRAYSRRLSQTPGVVCLKTVGVDAEVEIEEIVPIHAEGGPVDEAFHTLRAAWELPDGQELVEGCEVYRHAREIGLGFYYRWRVPAPKVWLEKRKAWGAWCREKLSGSRTFDSPDDVAQAFPRQPELLEWRAVRDSYKPETTLVWIDTSVLRLCVQWLKDHDGIAATEHSQFGEALAKMADVPYFGAGGVDFLGRSIEDFEGRSCVASIAANGEGRNLHKRLNARGRLVGFDQMLICSPPPNGPIWEQLLGRLHRTGLLTKLCKYWVIMGCREQNTAFWQALRDAENCARDLNGEEPKLTIADITATPLEDQPSGWCWGNVK